MNAHLRADWRRVIAEKGFLDQITWEHSRPGSAWPQEHTLYAHHPDHDRAIGHLSWSDRDGEVGEVEVRDGHRHKGLATHMWNKASEIDPRLRHSEYQTDEGRDWARTTGHRAVANLDSDQRRALDRLAQLPEDLVQGEPAHRLFAEHNIHLHEEDPWEAGEVGDGHVTKDTGRSRFHAPDAPLHTSQDYLWRPTLEHFIRHPEDATAHEERPSTWTHEGQHWINGGHHRILADRMSGAQGTEVSDRTGHTASRGRW